MTKLTTRTLEEYIPFIEEYLEKDPLCVHDCREVLVEKVPKNFFGNPQSNMQLGLCVSLPEAVAFIESLGYDIGIFEPDEYGKRQKVTKNRKYVGYLYSDDTSYVDKIYESHESPGVPFLWGVNKPIAQIKNVGAKLLFTPTLGMSDEDKKKILNQVNWSIKINLPKNKKTITLREYIDSQDSIFWGARIYAELNLKLLNSIQDSQLPMYYYQPNNPGLFAVQGEELETLVKKMKRD